MFRVLLAAAFAVLVSTKCLPLSATTCYADNKTCDPSYGPTTCLQGVCICLPGYCADSKGVCKGCSEWNIKAVGFQQPQSGDYKLVPGWWIDYKLVPCGQMGRTTSTTALKTATG
eukprot:GDKI01014188.1.p2 GENE.GDKI01014188.1~~GDKI01014188.1.p2  ORF type:complete len:115 (-),score=10.80 GDKI01014188.1:433-777(-)